MIAGKRFTLEKRGLCLNTVGGMVSPMYIPAGATIEVKSDPTYGMGLVNVLWESREVKMFLSEIAFVGKQIVELNPPSQSLVW
jgi:hypothetical protein